MAENKLQSKSSNKTNMNDENNTQELIIKNNNNSSTSVTPLQRKRKRKLFSSKDMEILNEQRVTEASDESDDMIPLSKYKKESKWNTSPIRLNIRDIPTPESEAVCYKEHENVRKKHIHQSKTSESKMKSHPLDSPRKLRNDQTFDELRESVNYNKVKCVKGKKTVYNPAIYNITSESENEELKKKYSKRNLAIYDFTSERKGRVGSSSGEVTKHDTKKRRFVKRQNTKGKGRNTDINIIKDLNDEKMRNAKGEDLNSSFIAVINQNDAQREEGPKLRYHSQLEIIPENELGEKEEIEHLEQKPKKNKQNKKFSLKKKKKAEAESLQSVLRRYAEQQERDGPLPELIIEYVPKKIKDDQSSFNSSEMVKICKKYMQELDEELTTHAENINYSPRQSDIPVEIDICEKLEGNINNNLRNKKLDNKKRKTIDSTTTNVNNKKKRTNDSLYSWELGTINEEKEIHAVDSDIQELVMVKEDKNYGKVLKLKQNQKQDSIEIEYNLNIKDSEKSIKTADLDVSLSPQTLSEHISPRNLELQDLDSPKREYFLLLRDAIGENTNQKDACKKTSCSAAIQKGENHNYFTESKNNPKKKILSVTSPVKFEIIEEDREMDMSPKIQNITDDLLKNNCIELFSQCNSHESSSQGASPALKSGVKINTSKMEMLSASGKSLNSVLEWTIRELPKSLSESGDHSACKDSIQSVLEKLDTTLLDVNQNTSRKFVHLFVEMKTFLDEAEKKRKELCNNATQQVTRLFMDINEKSNEMKENFNLELKRRAAELIREDSQQKRTMVLMLREDIEAAMGKLERRRSL